VTADDFHRSWDLFAVPDGAAELRVLNTRFGQISGYFTDVGAFAREARRCDEIPGANVYVTVNPAKRDLLARAVNRVVPYAKHATGDQDIIGRRWLPLDFDPVRPAGIAATEAEHTAARDRARAAFRWLQERDVPPEAVVAVDSGNGAHLLLRVDLPNDDASREAVRRVLVALSLRFDNDAVKVDLGMFNAARIVRLPGTVNRKGDGTPDRPHRRSRLLVAPERIVVCPHTVIEGIAALAPEEPKREGGSVRVAALDLARWLETHALAVRKVKPWQGGTVHELEACPFNSDHVGGSALVGQHASGATFFRCFHNGCTGKDWHDLRELKEPGHQERRDHAGDYRENGTTVAAKGSQADRADAALPWTVPEHGGKEGTEAWGGPVEFNAPTCGPTVPLEALPPAIHNYVSEVTASHQVPVDFVAASALGVLAAAGAGRAIVKVGTTHTEPLNLYIAPVLESGERKQVLRAMTFPLEYEERRLVEEARPTIVKGAQERAIAEERIKLLQKRAANSADAREREQFAAEAAAIGEKLPSAPAWPQLLFDDATPEYVAKALAEQSGRAAIVSEEAGSLFEVLAGRYTNGLPALDVHLKAYDGGTIRCGRISRAAVLVERPALTIVVTPQPSVLDRLAAQPEFRGRGLLARFVFVIPATLVGGRMYQDRPVSPTARAVYGEAIGRILRRPLPAAEADVPRLLLTGDALAIWANFANKAERAQAEGGTLVGIRDWASKHAGRVARLAGNLHLVEHPSAADGDHISPETVAAAWALGEWMEAHALVAFARMGADREAWRARWVLDWIRRHGLSTFTLKQLADHKRDVDRPADFLPALTILEARGFIRRDPEPETRGPGRRPSPSWTVNPRSHSQNSQNSHNSTASTGAEPFSELREFGEGGSA
jgi:hypothetical protein